MVGLSLFGLPEQNEKKTHLSLLPPQICKNMPFVSNRFWRAAGWWEMKMRLEGHTNLKQQEEKKTEHGNYDVSGSA